LAVAITPSQENTRKYLSEVQRVEDWDYNFLPLPSGGIPSEVFARERSLKLNGSSIGLKYYGPAHTDSDIAVTFGEADVVHVADTYWNGIYPFIDYSTGGSIDDMIAASDANLAATTDKTIIIPGHGQPVSNRASMPTAPTRRLPKTSGRPARSSWRSVWRMRDVSSSRSSRRPTRRGNRADRSGLRHREEDPRASG
jgi:glyoxylase-like metal-dependent hydrolase (beta-lactamase superfamily II)